MMKVALLLRQGVCEMMQLVSGRKTVSYITVNIRRVFLILQIRKITEKLRYD